MGIQLSESARRLVDGRNYAVLATVNPDGSPQTSVVWVGRDGGDLLFSTVEGRVKHRNMVRDPRVSVSVIDSADPENYVELRGRVSMTPRAKSCICSKSEKLPRTCDCQVSCAGSWLAR